MPTYKFQISCTSSEELEGYKITDSYLFADTHDFVGEGRGYLRCYHKDLPAFVKEMVEYLIENTSSREELVDHLGNMKFWHVTIFDCDCVFAGGEDGMTNKSIRRIL